MAFTYQALQDNAKVGDRNNCHRLHALKLLSHSCLKSYHRCHNDSHIQAVMLRTIRAIIFQQAPTPLGWRDNRRLTPAQRLLGASIHLGCTADSRLTVSGQHDIY